MTDTTRELIQRMANELDLYRQMARNDCTSTHPFADEARAYLDQSEPEDKALARVEFAKRDFDGPSDAILAQYCDNWFYGDPERTEVDPVDLCRGAIRLFAQIPAPTPVSERLPGPEDCSHPEGECWWFDPASDGAWYIDTYQGNYTYWLPHYALPTPQP